MEGRKYAIAFAIAKVGEILGFLVMIGGIFIGAIGFGKDIEMVVRILFPVVSIILGLILIFASQLTLIFIDTENNTNIIAKEAVKTNAMLSAILQESIGIANKRGRLDIKG